MIYRPYRSALIDLDHQVGIGHLSDVCILSTFVPLRIPEGVAAL